VKTCVLAYSGGLDTSIIIPWLRETYGCRVVAFIADVGQDEDLEAARWKALRTGAAEAIVDDLRETFLRDYVFPALQAGAVYENGYLLGTALARPPIAKRQAERALEIGADALAHGCTGKGNDQVRFELAYKAVAPGLRVVAPWREWAISSREEALAYALAHGVPVDATPGGLFSRDANLWHTSHEGGILEDPASAPPESMFVRTTSPEKCPARGVEVAVGFERGVPVSIDGNALDPIALVTRLNAIAGAHGIGRADLVESRVVGMKSRGVYETPAGTVLHAAHAALEGLTLDRETLRLKAQLAVAFADLAYAGQWFTPIREALSAFVSSTQRFVTGTVTLRLRQGSVSVRGRASSESLYDASLGSFTMRDDYDQADAAGFINIVGLPAVTRARARTAAAGARDRKARKRVEETPEPTRRASRAARPAARV
jgi:argininosuccinate synthase